MDFRNPVKTSDGRVNCEINHPKFGWIPFTASPDDVMGYGREIYAQAVDAATEYVAPPPVPAVPSSCSPLQMRRALRQLGYKAAVDAYIAQQTEEVQEAWEYATVIERSDPLMADAIALLSAQLGLDAQATGDALFTLAVTL